MKGKEIERILCQESKFSRRKRSYLQCSEYNLRVGVGHSSLLCSAKRAVSPWKIKFIKFCV